MATEWQEVHFNGEIIEFPVDMSDDEITGVLSGLVTGTEQEEVQVSAVDSVFGELEAKEGARGDTTGAAVTGEIGVTDSARQAVGATEDMTDRQVAHSYLNLLDDKWAAAHPNYANAPKVVQEVLLDAAYNIGEGVMRYGGVSSALKEQNWERVGLELLDTASIGGRASRGIAARRAESYNRLNDKQITHIDQAEDGTLTYLAGKDVVFSYRPRNGRHDSSKVGKLEVKSTKGAKEIQQASKTVQVAAEPVEQVRGFTITNRRELKGLMKELEQEENRRKLRIGEFAVADDNDDDPFDLENLF